MITIGATSPVEGVVVVVVVFVVVVVVVRVSTLHP